MSIADQINRLNNAKAAIKQSIINKGVEVKDSALLDEYPALIDSIEVGSGEGGADSESVWNIITDNGTRGQYLFRDCKNLTELDVSHLDTSNMTSMSNMFYNCQSLTELDLSNFDTSKVTNMGYMFYNCQALTTLNLSNFNTSNVTDMTYMFCDCKNLTELDVSNFDTSKVTNMNYMFSGSVNSVKFTSIKGINDLDISKVTNMSGMFSKNWSITSLDVSNWDVSHITSSYGLDTIFDNCKLLVDLYPPKNISANMKVSSSTALSHDSLMSIINNLITTTSTKKLTLGTTNLAKLTDDEKAIATNKGWTLA